ncbi:YceD family protein [Kordiimonas pumila]|uniref:YceD family protein n=1 Tax=Kordiimonas pumila TaxID=2161677 RepID=A0ABV7D1X7_9PROT|nr:DUF177 domain-containing protein [Kordiimonas pumila]
MTVQHDLDFVVQKNTIGRDPLSYKVTATSEQLKTLAERFDLVSVSFLDAAVTVKAVGDKDRILVTGTVKTALVQRCIVSLQDVPEQLDVPFTLLLVDPETADQMDADETYLDDDAPDYDSFDGDRVEVGEIVAQTVAVSMNPYPRADAAVPDLGKNPNISFGEPDVERKNPFDVLSKLKDES